MKKSFTMKPIATVQGPFSSKFGIPRQSGRVAEAVSRIVFEPEYRNEEALRGLEGFSHIWILWIFSENEDCGFSPTVRPPRLGGNRRMGVFATRSPYRPNPIGLSCCAITRIEYSSPQGPYIEVSGADLMDGTPILDLKPYLPSADCIPHAEGGFADSFTEYRLKVLDPQGVLNEFPEQLRKLIFAVLAEDPRPSYQKDPERVYSFECSGVHVSFCVNGDTAILKDVCKCQPSERQELSKGIL